MSSIRSKDDHRFHHPAGEGDRYCFGTLPDWLLREIPASQEKPAEVVQQNRRNQIRTNNKQLCHFHTINNVPLHYVETGDRAKPSLVFTGSVLFRAEGFDDLVPLLEKDFHIIRIDVHGHGPSGLRIPLCLEKMADDCYDLLVPLGLSKPVWVGHSIGGMLGMRIAYKHPEAFAALVLSDHRTTRTAAVARSNLAALASVSRWSTGHHRRSSVAVLFCPSHFPHAAGVGSALSRLDHQLSRRRECLSVCSRGVRTNRHHRVSASDCCSYPRDRRERTSRCATGRIANHRGTHPQCPVPRH
jgi:pimeloyl-ACP methyl ester carboxylesterase